MNPRMVIKQVISDFATRLAKEIANLRSPSVDTIEKAIRDYQEFRRDECHICRQPYEKAAYLSNGEDYDSFKGGIICKSCLEKALEVI